MSRNPVTISLEDGILTEIDSVKGKNEPRSRFLEDIISDFLDKKRKTSPHPKGSDPKSPPTRRIHS